MCKRSKILAFLTLNENWDPSLILVMGGALLVAFPIFQFILYTRKAPIFDERFELPVKTEIDWRVVIGPLIFGMGWGITGLCPGPAFVSMFFYPQGLVMVATMLSGMNLASYLAIN